MPVVVIRYNRLTGYYGSGGWTSGLIAVTGTEEREREAGLNLDAEVLLCLSQWVKDGYCGICGIGSV